MKFKRVDEKASETQRDVGVSLSIHQCVFTGQPGTQAGQDQERVPTAASGLSSNLVHSPGDSAAPAELPAPAVLWGEDRRGHSLTVNLASSRGGVP